MIKHGKMSDAFSLKPWKPDRPVSRGAAAYHDAVSNAEYYMDILDELMRIVRPHIKENEIVVDFGAGTGVSALRLLEHLKVKINLWLVDNSAAWLGKAYQVFSSNPNVKCFLLEKKEKGYFTLADTIGRKVADHVLSANTVHLIPDLEETFKGIAASLKDNGTFTFDSGNITMHGTPTGALMVDDTVKRVHDIALDIVRKDPRFEEYKKALDERIKMTESQRKFVFPDPRPVESYLGALKKAGFNHDEPHSKLVKVKYSDWLRFLRVRRLQAGILPEIGGNEPTLKEENDRDTLITLATGKLFDELKSKNPLADKERFTLEFVYVKARKSMQSRNLLLEGKNALVTGASRGIGKAIAIELARRGANVVVNYNTSEKDALEVENEIKSNVKAIALKANVADFEEVSKMFEVVKKEFGKLDILVNNAGIIIDKTLQNMEKEDWGKVIKTNLTGVYNVTRSALPLMGKNGRIINISSIVALDGNFGQTNYAASKAGIIGFTKSLAKEVGKYGITVNAVAPGLIETDIIKGIPASRRKEIDNIIPLGRVGKPEEVANVVAFLASGRAAYITGEVIAVNGGLRF